MSVSVPLLAALKLSAVSRCLKHIDEPAGKAAVLWMVGEYGDEITVRGEERRGEERTAVAAFVAFPSHSPVLHPTQKNVFFLSSRIDPT